MAQRGDVGHAVPAVERAVVTRLAHAVGEEVALEDVAAAWARARLGARVRARARVGVGARVRARARVRVG